MIQQGSYYRDTETEMEEGKEEKKKGRRKGKEREGKERSIFKTAVKIMKYLEIKLTENALRCLWIKLLITIEEQKA